MNARLFWGLLSMEVRKVLSYRANFWTNSVLGFIVQLGAVYYLWRAMFLESGRNEIGGMTFPQMISYYLTVLLLGRIVRGIDFGAAGLSDEIYSGSLTRYLVYPTKTFLIKYAQLLGQVLPSVAQLVVFGGICFLLFPVRNHVPITLSSLAMASVSVMLGNLLHFIFYWPVDCVAFWQDNVWSLNVMTRFILSVLGGAWLPLTVFPEAAQQVLHYLPFRFLYAFPAEVLMGRVGPLEWLVGTGVCIAWCAALSLVARVVWQKGVKQYSGVGI